MPLTKGSTTRASLVALPGHALFATALGIAWLWQAPPQSSAGLEALDSVWPLENTAFVLVCLGVVELGMLLFVHNRAVEAVTLVMGALVMVMLAVMSTSGHVAGTSWGPVIIWIYVAAMHFASVVSLAFNESRSQ